MTVHCLRHLRLLAIFPILTRRLFGVYRGIFSISVISVTGQIVLQVFRLYCRFILKYWTNLEFTYVN